MDDSSERHRRGRWSRSLTRPAAWVAIAVGFGPAEAAAQYALFQSHQSANLATTETLRGGNWIFEISHRFQVPISEGPRELWGVDGPARIRLGLGWSPVEHVLLGVIRTNAEDNLELNGRFRFVESEVAGAPVHLAVVSGGAWNTDPVLTQGAEDNEFQLYGQLLANTVLADELAIGLAPTVLHNARIRDFDSRNVFALGLYGQWYASRSLSVLGEWIFAEEIEELEHDSGSFGLEVRTRGHHFKLLVTNQPAMNPTQHLAGSRFPFTLDQLRFGFNITRLLPF